MNRINLSHVIYFILCSALLVGCAGKGSAPRLAGSKNDSTSVADTSSRPDSLTTGPSLPYEQRQGKFLYTKYCAVCHGDEGKGDGFNAFNLDPKPRDFSDAKYMNELTDDRLTQTITGGGRSVNRSDLMPSWGGRMTKEEILYVVSYVRTFSARK